MNEIAEKIAEIVKKIAEDAETCTYEKLSNDKASLDFWVKAILVLIEREQAKHNTTRWYIAKKHYDEGIETQEDRDILSGAIDSLDCTECMKQAKESIREEFERREKPMREALKVARCPDCDGSGAIPHRITDRQYVTHDMASDAGDPALEGSLYSRDDFELEQCQWCDERKRLLEEFNG